MAALTVEHLKVMAASRACLRILSMAALTVEHLKVMAALSVEPAYASLSVEPPKG